MPIFVPGSIFNARDMAVNDTGWGKKKKKQSSPLGANILVEVMF